MTDIEELPPSAKYVHRVLENRGPLTYGEIVEETNLGERTVSNAVTSLREADLVDENFYPGDARKSLYDVME